MEKTMKTLSVLVIGVAVLMAMSAQASIVALTNTSQLDTSMAKDGSGAPLGGYAMDLYSGANYTVNGLTFMPDAYGGFFTLGVVGGAVGSASWYGAPTPAGTDGAALQAICDSFQYGGLSYTFAVTAGQTYNLQWIGSNPGAGGNFTLDFSSTPGVDEPSLTYAAGNFLYTGTFTANAPTVTLAMNYGAGGYPVVSGIVINPVPEPATMSLLGLGSLALLRRRR